VVLPAVNEIFSRFSLRRGRNLPNLAASEAECILETPALLVGRITMSLKAQ